MRNGTNHEPGGRSGANGTLGTAQVVQAEPDGYTLLFSSSSIAPTPYVYKHLSYDLLRDLAPIATVGTIDGYLMLVNPGVPVPTKDVFARLGLSPGERRGVANEIGPGPLKDGDTLIAYLESQPNDLEAPARALAPVISEVLAALAACEGCLLARMSGSGATCFGLFASNATTAAAQQVLQKAHPAWWIAPTVFARSAFTGSACMVSAKLVVNPHDGHG